MAARALYETTLKGPPTKFLPVEDSFVASTHKKIKKVEMRCKKANQTPIFKVHTSKEDFYSLDYTLVWLNIIKDYPNSLFYSFTKEVDRFKAIFSSYWYVEPKNLYLIYIYSPETAKFINIETDLHIRTFSNKEELENNYYEDMSKDHMMFLNERINRLGIIK